MVWTLLRPSNCKRNKIFKFLSKHHFNTVTPVWVELGGRLVSAVYRFWQLRPYQYCYWNQPFSCFGGKINFLKSFTVLFDFANFHHKLKFNFLGPSKENESFKFLSKHHFNRVIAVWVEPRGRLVPTVPWFWPFRPHQFCYWNWPSSCLGGKRNLLKSYTFSVDFCDVHLMMVWTLLGPSNCKQNKSL